MGKKSNIFILKKSNKLLKDFVEDSFHELAPLGSYQIYLLIVILFLINGFFNEFKFLILGFILINLIGIPIRYYFFKERPIPKKYDNLIEKIFASSFPSMHSSRSIFLGLFFTFYLNNLISIIIIWLIIITILYSRIYTKRHYWIDIFGGIILGLFIYLILIYLFNINLFI